jgi:hypothetical protein
MTSAGYNAYARCGAEPGYFGVFGGGGCTAWGVLVLCVRLGRLSMLRPRAGRAVVYMGRVRLRSPRDGCAGLSDGIQDESVGDIGKGRAGGRGCAVRSKGRKAKKVEEFDVS